MDRDLLESMLADGLSLAAIGRRVGRHESTVAAYVGMYGLHAVNVEKHAARGGLTREQLEPLVQAGMSIAQIAAELHRSKATVRHWLRQHEMKTRPSRMRRVAQSRAARTAGLSRTTMRCVVHGETEFAVTRGGYFRCLLCRSAAVTKRRRRVKEILVAEAGGKCILCGYDRCVAALEFHHRDRANKRFELSERGVTRSLARLTRRPVSARCFAATATLRSRPVSLARSLRLAYNAPSPRRIRGSSFRGSSTGRCARLLIERLWVRVPPPEFFAVWFRPGANSTAPGLRTPGPGPNTGATRPPARRVCARPRLRSRLPR
jgi:DNA-binding CsgD family transcriptional regulator